MSKPVRQCVLVLLFIQSTATAMIHEDIEAGIRSYSCPASLKKLFYGTCSGLGTTASTFIFEIVTLDAMRKGTLEWNDESLPNSFFVFAACTSTLFGILIGSHVYRILHEEPQRVES